MMMCTFVVGLLALASTPARAQDLGPENTFLIRAGGGMMPLTDHSLLGVNVGAAFRTEWDWFAVEFEPVAATIDAFGKPNGLRIGFLHPSARFMFLPDQMVSPSASIGVGGSYTFANNDDDTAGEYAALAFEGRVSVGVDLNRGHKVRPGMTIDFVYPLAPLYGTDSLRARPPFLMANLHLGFDTRRSVWEAITGWL